MDDEMRLRIQKLYSVVGPMTRDHVAAMMKVAMDGGFKPVEFFAAVNDAFCTGMAALFTDYHKSAHEPQHQEAFLKDVARAIYRRVQDMVAMKKEQEQEKAQQVETMLAELFKNTQQPKEDKP